MSELSTRTEGKHLPSTLSPVTPVEKLAIFLLVPTAALGPHLLPIGVMGITVYGFRILVGLAILWCFVSGRHRKDRSLTGQLYLALGFLWITWGIAGLFWTPSPLEGAQELMAIIFGFLVFVAFVQLGGVTTEGLSYVQAGWVTAYCITLAVAIWELLSGSHLESSWSLNAPAYKQVGMASSTFSNPNNYAAFLVLSFPFLVKTFQGLRRKWGKMLLLFLLLSMPVPLIATRSRLAIVAILVQIVMLSIMNLRMNRRIGWVYMAISVVLAGMIVYMGGNEQLRTLISPFGNVFGAVQVRANLMVNGIIYTINSFGIGIGPGAYEWYTLYGKGAYTTLGIVNPHSFWIEILSQYGVVLFLFLVGWLVMAVKGIVKARRRGVHMEWMNTALIGIAGYVLAVNGNSSYIDQPANWVFLAIFAAVSAIGWNTQRTPADRPRS